MPDGWTANWDRSINTIAVALHTNPQWICNGSVLALYWLCIGAVLALYWRCIGAIINPALMSP